MSIRTLFLFVIILLYWNSFWTICDYLMFQYNYRYNKFEDETKFSYAKRYYKGSLNIFRTAKFMRLVYDSKLLKIFAILKMILLALFATGLLICYLHVINTDYVTWLDIIL